MNRFQVIEENKAHEPIITGRMLKDIVGEVYRMSEAGKISQAEASQIASFVAARCLHQRAVPRFDRLFTRFDRLLNKMSLELRASHE